ncbi:MAG: DUF63 family protein [Candidatus Aenigmarchaeota archaeon]|nr:DUF63 family protein [Candidatus Aenigmarchaeota archaeon]
MALDFFNDYFIRPIIENTGYNAVNTAAYAIVFALAVFGIYRLLRRLQINIDKKFFLGIFPFILFGSLLRVLQDTNLYTTYLLVSPVIYFVIFLVALAGLGAALAIARYVMKDAQRYWKPWMIIGWVFALFALVLLIPAGSQNPGALLIAAGITAAWGVVIYAGYRYREKIRQLAWMTKENSLLLFTHMFDASTTFTALQFYASQGYFEQHVLSNFLIGFLGPAGQFLLKLIVVPLVLWVLDKELRKDEEKQLRGFLKIAVFIVGFAPGLRNIIRLVIGV